MLALRLGSIALALMLAGCVTDEVRERPASAEEDGLVGTIRLVVELRELPEEKTLVAAYRFAANTVEPIEARVVPGAGGMPRTESGDFRIVLLDRDGQALREYGIRNPRRLLVERHGMIETPEALYVARFGFDARAREIRVLDRKRKILATTDLLPAMREFCTTATADEDCRRLSHDDRHR
jgi:hypothetical protein